VLDCDFVDCECFDVVEQVLSVVIRDFGSVHLTYFWKVKKEDLVLSAQISCLVRSLTLWLSAQE
jgi:hypothetical protein